MSWINKKPWPVKNATGYSGAGFALGANFGHVSIRPNAGHFQKATGLPPIGSLSAHIPNPGTPGSFTADMAQAQVDQIKRAQRTVSAPVNARIPGRAKQFFNAVGCLAGIGRGPAPPDQIPLFVRPDVPAVKVDARQPRLQTSSQAALRRQFDVDVAQGTNERLGAMKMPLRSATDQLTALVAQTEHVEVLNQSILEGAEQAKKKFAEAFSARKSASAEFGNASRQVLDTQHALAKLEAKEAGLAKGLKSIKAEIKANAGLRKELEAKLAGLPLEPELEMRRAVDTHLGRCLGLKRAAATFEEKQNDLRLAQQNLEAAKQQMRRARPFSNERATCRAEVIRCRSECNKARLSLERQQVVRTNRHEQVRKSEKTLTDLQGRIGGGVRAAILAKKDQLNSEFGVLNKAGINVAIDLAHCRKAIPAAKQAHDAAKEEEVTALIKRDKAAQAEEKAKSDAKRFGEMDESLKLVRKNLSPEVDKAIKSHGVLQGMEEIRSSQKINIMVSSPPGFDLVQVTPGLRKQMALLVEHLHAVPADVEPGKEANYRRDRIPDEQALEIVSRCLSLATGGIGDDAEKVLTDLMSRDFAGLVPASLHNFNGQEMLYGVPHNDESQVKTFAALIAERPSGLELLLRTVEPAATKPSRQLRDAVGVYYRANSALAAFKQPADSSLAPDKRPGHQASKEYLEFAEEAAKRLAHPKPANKTDSKALADLHQQQRIAFNGVRNGYTSIAPGSAYATANKFLSEFSTKAVDHATNDAYKTSALHARQLAATAAADVGLPTIENDLKAELSTACNELLGKTDAELLRARNRVAEARRSNPSSGELPTVPRHLLAAHTLLHYISKRVANGSPFNALTLDSGDWQAIDQQVQKQLKIESAAVKQVSENELNQLKDFPSPALLKLKMERNSKVPGTKDWMALDKAVQKRQRIEAPNLPANTVILGAGVKQLGANEPNSVKDSTTQARLQANMARDRNLGDQPVFNELGQALAAMRDNKKPPKFLEVLETLSQHLGDEAIAPSTAGQALRPDDLPPPSGKKPTPVEGDDQGRLSQQLGDEAIAPSTAGQALRPDDRPPPSGKKPTQDESDDQGLSVVNHRLRAGNVLSSRGVMGANLTSGGLPSESSEDEVPANELPLSKPSVSGNKVLGRLTTDSVNVEPPSDSSEDEVPANELPLSKPSVSGNKVLGRSTTDSVNVEPPSDSIEDEVPFDEEEFFDAEEDLFFDAVQQESLSDLTDEEVLDHPDDETVENINRTSDLRLPTVPSTENQSEESGLRNGVELPFLAELQALFDASSTRRVSLPVGPVPADDDKTVVISNRSSDLRSSTVPSTEIQSEESGLRNGGELPFLAELQAFDASLMRPVSLPVDPAPAEDDKTVVISNLTSVLPNPTVPGTEIQSEAALSGALDERLAMIQAVLHANPDESPSDLTADEVLDDSIKDLQARFANLQPAKTPEKKTTSMEERLAKLGLRGEVKQPVVGEPATRRVSLPVDPVPAGDDKTVVISKLNAALEKARTLQRISDDFASKKGDFTEEELSQWVSKLVDGAFGNVSFNQGHQFSFGTSRMLGVSVGFSKYLGLLARPDVDITLGENHQIRAGRDSQGTEMSISRQTVRSFGISAIAGLGRGIKREGEDALAVGPIMQWTQTFSAMRTSGGVVMRNPKFDGKEHEQLTEDFREMVETTLKWKGIKDDQQKQRYNSPMDALLDKHPEISIATVEKAKTMTQSGSVQAGGFFAVDFDNARTNGFVGAAAGILSTRTSERGNLKTLGGSQGFAVKTDARAHTTKVDAFGGARFGYFDANSDGVGVAVRGLLGGITGALNLRRTSAMSGTSTVRAPNGALVADRYVEYTSYEKFEAAVNKHREKWIQAGIRNGSWPDDFPARDKRIISEATLDEFMANAKESLKAGTVTLQENLDVTPEVSAVMTANIALEELAQIEGRTADVDALRAARNKVLDDDSSYQPFFLKAIVRSNIAHRGGLALPVGGQATKGGDATHLFDWFPRVEKRDIFKKNGSGASISSSDASTNGSGTSTSGSDTTTSSSGTTTSSSGTSTSSSDASSSSSDASSSGSSSSVSVYSVPPDPPPVNRKKPDLSGSANGASNGRVGGASGTPANLGEAASRRNGTQTLPVSPAVRNDQGIVGKPKTWPSVSTVLGRVLQPLSNPSTAPRRWPDTADDTEREKLKNPPTDYPNLRVGIATGDGDCLFHSFIKVAGPELKRQMREKGWTGRELTPLSVRRYVAEHIINVLTDPGPNEAVIRNDYQSYFVEDLETTTLSEADMLETEQKLRTSLSEGMANRAVDLHVLQQAHIAKVLTLKHWNSRSADLMPKLLANAFPGVELRLYNDRDTPHERVSETFIEGQRRFLRPALSSSGSPLLRVCVFRSNDVHYSPALEITPPDV